MGSSGGGGSLARNTAHKAPGHDPVKTVPIVESELMKERAHLVPTPLLYEEGRAGLDDVAHLSGLADPPETARPMIKLNPTVARHPGSSRRVDLVPKSSHPSPALGDAVPLAQGMPDAVHRPRTEVRLLASGDVALAEPSVEEPSDHLLQIGKGTDGMYLASPPCPIGTRADATKCSQRRSRIRRHAIPHPPGGSIHPKPHAGPKTSAGSCIPNLR